MAASKSTLTPGQNAVLGFLKRRGPLTDGELVALYPADRTAVTQAVQTPSGLRTRRAELVKKGYVTQHSVTKSLTGRQTVKWEAV
jgi:hypothetical protein